MYCNCMDKKPLTNEANRVVFTVCAKSKGGCGKEIRAAWGDFRVADIECRVRLRATCSECDGYGIKVDMEICENCRGSGSVEIN